MENTIKPQKIISQKIAEVLFILYMITLYIFEDKEKTVMISKIVFVIFAIFTVIAVLRSRSIHIGKNVMVVYVAFTWMFATVFWARNEHDASIMMKTMWQLFILFFLTYNLFCKQPDAHDTILKALYISGIVLIIYSIYIYGFVDVIGKLASNTKVRLGREINQANTFGMMNATTVIVAFYYLFHRKRFKIFHILVMSVSFIYAMSSGSRKALLMICIGVLFLLFKKYGIKKLYKFIIIGLLLVVAFVMLIRLPMFELIKNRMEQFVEVITEKGKGDASAKARLQMITEGWKIFKDRILVGYGANNYRIVSTHNTYAHNNFIEILVNFGLVGFFLYYSVYFMAFKNLRTSKTNAEKALLSIFVVRFLMEIAMVTYYDKIHWILIAFFLISSQDKKLQKKSEEYPVENSEENIFNAEEISADEDSAEKGGSKFLRH